MRNAIAGALVAGPLIVVSACGISAVGSKDLGANGGDASGSGDVAVGPDGAPIVDPDGGSGGADANPTNDGGGGDGGNGRVPGALALYKFDDGTGKKVSDVSGVAPALDLTIQVNDQTQWTTGGLAVTGPSLLFSQAASKIVSACKMTNEVTVETWIKPITSTNGTIQRITGISVQVANPVVTISAQNDTYLFRIRTSGQLTDGDNDIFTSGVLKLARQHVVMTRSANGIQRGYVDGVLATAEHPTVGDLSSWTDLAIAVANEHTVDRPWLGELQLVAYYGRALTLSEIKQNYAAGP